MLLGTNETRWLIDERHVARLATAAKEVAADDGTRRLAAERSGPASRRSAASGIGIINISGPLEARQSFFGWLMGSQPMDVIAADFVSLWSDPTIKQILLRFDSPGGTVSGTVELASLLYSYRGKGKPIIGVIDGMACSAAYWIATACDELYITRSGETGSIGCYSVHFDESGALEKAGVAATIIRSPKAKIEFNSLEPLTPEALKYEQAAVEKLHAEFVWAVAEHRGTTRQNVMTKMGQGRAVDADHALANGMVDGIKSFPQVIDTLRAAKPGNSTSTRAAEDAAHVRRAEAARVAWVRQENERLRKQYTSKATSTATATPAVATKPAKLARVLGYACLWDQPVYVSRLSGGGLHGKVALAPGVFDATLASSDDVILTIDHGNYPLARRSDFTLTLAADDVGLQVRADLPDTPLGRTVRDSIASGQLSGMSCSYAADDDSLRYLHSQQDGQFTRVGSAKLVEVCVTATPANKRCTCSVS